MKNVNLTINGMMVESTEGVTILRAAKDAGISIPTFCYHEELAPFGACRLCTVEITKNDKKQLVASCVYPVEEGLIVETDSERVVEVRRLILELLLPLAQTGPIMSIARQYGVTASRFPTKETACILCGLCVRYCAEIKKANAVTFVGRGINREVAFVPEIASQVCDNCRECFSICPGGKLARETDGASFPYPAWQSC